MHLNKVHSYPFWDLDGRQPDLGMVAYGWRSLYPTWALEQAREGIEDVLLYESSCMAVEQENPDTGTLSTREQAAATLARLQERLETAQRPASVDFDPRRSKREILSILERLQASPTGP